METLDDDKLPIILDFSFILYNDHQKEIEHEQQLAMPKKKQIARKMSVMHQL
jgi:hypothetical protein